MPMSEDMRKRFDEIFKDVPRRNVDDLFKPQPYQEEFVKNLEDDKTNRVVLKNVKG